MLKDTYNKHIFVETANIRQKHIQRQTQWLSDPSRHALHFLRIKIKILHMKTEKLRHLKTKRSSNFFSNCTVICFAYFLKTQCITVC